MIVPLKEREEGEGNGEGEGEMGEVMGEWVGLGSGEQ